MLTAALAALSLAAYSLPASASVTVGQVAPGVPTSCSNSFDFLQSSAPGDVYAMPAAGVITSWTHRSQAGNGQTPTLKVFRKIAEPARYQVVGHDGPHPIAANTLGTFPASIAVKAGDVLGLTGAGGAVNIGCTFAGPGQDAFRNGNLADGGFDDFTLGSNSRLNVSATLNPTNAFTLGAVTRNRKRGSATLAVTVPNPGMLALSGKGVRPAAGARPSVAVAGPGTVKLPVGARGKRKQALEAAGRVKLRLRITFTPTGGDPSTRSAKLKLRKN